MPEYRDPKVTTPRNEKSNMGKWIGIAIAAVLALLLLAWLFGAFDTEPVEVPPATVPAEPVTPPPAQ